MSSTAMAKSLALIGKVSLAQVKDANKKTGDMWLAAISVAAQAVQTDVRNLFTARADFLGSAGH